MDAVTLLTYFEIASSVAVLVTLVYLAIQIKQENILLRAEARQAQVSTDQAHLGAFIEHPDLAKTFAGKEPVSDEEKTRMQFWIIASLRAREFEWSQYQAGALHREDWLTYRQVIFFTLGSERARQYWRLCKAFFAPDFVAEVDHMISDAPISDYWDKVEQVD